ncbi:conserved domain protein (plasmid) [Bacillus anthracis str. A0488]|uniref:Conserved domain protein n=1 Tax=Bacillus anthracis TaxID=1392 RepID=Q6F032_BACAN|nr:hypothetical protein BX_B0068 [Bacillus anthracis str. A2012]AAT28998.2 conserved domain protein [Bacillus anthracis str. 'Ames Ancestor']ADK08310.1 conserved hypothetical protein [Bacillus cereus biovar anthracis str. CI]EDR16302.1 conserved domain protein [Bacillus anthracis str. A0488]EDR85175.1 conserved domain protein [Bacillus anthracis str. A0193]EDR90450.1 conserved domain protein [Bacillus anthracis str. A0442]EDS94313.1 conserved domain protein [Bacillus anthracis str. A0389]EDT
MNLFINKCSKLHETQFNLETIHSLYLTREKIYGLNKYIENNIG